MNVENNYSDTIIDQIFENKHTFKKSKAIRSLKKITLNNKEFCYILDLNQNKIISHRNIDKVLGYENNEIDLNFIFDQSHPDDANTVNRVAKAVTSFFLNTSTKSKHNSSLQIGFRIRKKDQSYIKVIKHSSPFKIDSRGNISQLLIKITDVNFLKCKICTCWDFNSEDVDIEQFKKHVYSSYANFFTRREVEIITAINEGLTSAMIAEKFYISKHTVSTHRKNILNKSATKGVEELISFCKRIGIL